MTSLKDVRQRAELDAKTHGYYLNPIPEFLNDLLEGLQKNEERYGYPSCPCRMATGNFDYDRDIICPCDYRDPDVEEFGACYCCLYVNKELYESKKTIPIPERRPVEKQVRAYGLEGDEKLEPEKEAKPIGKPMKTSRKLYYCKQCGYVAFREEPPYVCPVCRAKKELFAEIKPKIDMRST